MTPMIDVVFELIIFFVVTIKQEDIFSKLNANRPAPASSAAASEENDTQVKIDIGSGGLVFNGRMMNMKQFDQSMREISKTSKNSTATKNKKKRGENFFKSMRFRLLFVGK